jgi:hypothetical protein
LFDLTVSKRSAPSAAWPATPDQAQPADLLSRQPKLLSALPPTPAPSKTAASPASSPADSSEASSPTYSAPADASAGEAVERPTPSPRDRTTPSPRDGMPPSPSNRPTPAPCDRATPAPCDGPTPAPTSSSPSPTGASPSDTSPSSAPADSSPTPSPASSSPAATPTHPSAAETPRHVLDFGGSLRNAGEIVRGQGRRAFNHAEAQNCCSRQDGLWTEHVHCSRFLFEQSRSTTRAAIAELPILTFKEHSQTSIARRRR